jgi:hypothetical protein
MPDIHDVMDVTIEELSPKQQLQLKEAWHGPWGFDANKHSSE